MTVIIVGTSHVASESLSRIDTAISMYKPDVIGIELDKGRLQAMMSDAPSAGFMSVWKRAGLFAALFFTVGRILQQRIGTSLGFRPGSEMLYALKRAREHNIPVALVDRNIQMTLAALKRIPRKEKIRFVLDLIPGRVRDTGLENLDLSKVPADDVVETVLSFIEKRYPEFSRVLVHERNQVIAQNTHRLLSHYRVVMLVVGKAHARGIAELLGDLDIKTDR